MITQVYMILFDTFNNRIKSLIKKKKISIMNDKNTVPEMIIKKLWFTIHQQHLE